MPVSFATRALATAALGLHRSDSMVMLYEVMLWLRYGYVVAAATIAASAKTEAVSWLPCQPGENKRVCGCYGSAFSSSLLACTLPSLRSANNAHSEIQQDDWHHEQDWRCTGKMQSDNK